MCEQVRKHDWSPHDCNKIQRMKEDRTDLQSARLRSPHTQAALLHSTMHILHCYSWATALDHQVLLSRILSKLN